eukprot:scaffold4275_cov143-Skeletonema_marinoi.AAC.3
MKRSRLAIVFTEQSLTAICILSTMMPTQNLRGDLDETMLLMGSDGRDLTARELKKSKKPKQNEDDGDSYSIGDHSCTFTF